MTLATVHSELKFNSSIGRWRPFHRWWRLACAGGTCLGLVVLSGCSSTSPSDPSVWMTSQQQVRGQEPGLLANLRNRVIPQSATDLVQQAAEQYRNGQYEAALSTLRRARRSDPRLVTTWELEAEIAFDMGDHERCRTALDALRRGNPHSSRTHFRIGQKLQQLGDTDQAIAAFEKAHSLEPRRLEYVRMLSASYLQQGRRQEAAQVIDAGMRLHSDSVDLAMLAGRLHEEDGRWSDAAEAYRKAAAADPHNMQWHRHLGRCLYQLGVYDQAAREMATCYLRDRDVLSTVDFIYYGDACLRNGDVESARIVFDDLALHQHQRLREVELMRGLCALRQNRRGEAQQILATALERWPNDSQLVQLLEFSRRSAINAPSDNVQLTAHQDGATPPPAPPSEPLNRESTSRRLQPTENPARQTTATADWWKHEVPSEVGPKSQADSTKPVRIQTEAEGTDASRSEGTTPKSSPTDGSSTNVEHDGESAEQSTSEPTASWTKTRKSKTDQTGANSTKANKTSVNKTGADATGADATGADATGADATGAPAAGGTSSASVTDSGQ